jgi:hypothetical protein
LEGDYLWAVGFFLHSSLAEWFSRRCYCAQKRLREGDPLSPMLFIMLFIMSKAKEDGLLQVLSNRHKYNQISIYADDVALFLHPSRTDIAATLEILSLFGPASRLHNINQKSSVFPIQCSKDDVAVAQDLLPCEFSSFPCRYLGLSLSLRKISKEQAQPIVDRTQDSRPTSRLEGRFDD